MKELIIEHKEIAWVAGVILVNLLLHLMIAKSINIIQSRWRKADQYEPLFKAFRRVFRFFFIAFTIGLLSYIFVSEESYSTVTRNIGRVFWFTFVIMLTVILSAVSTSYFNHKVDQLSRRDSGDITLYKYINYLVTAFIYLVGIILIALAIPALTNLAAAAGASAGAIALVAGVASQEGISNIVGGLFIAFFKPFRIGDIVKIGSSTMGRVEDINLRHTVIKDFQNVRIVIPNAMVNKENISNYYMIESKNCEWIEIGISYDSDINLAIKVMQDICESHPLCMDVRSDADKKRKVSKVDVQVIGLGDSSVNLKAWVWSASYLTGFKMRNQLYKSIKEAFDKEGISIPFPHTSVIIKKSA